MEFDYVYLLAGIVTTGGSIFGLLRLVQSLGNDIDKFDMSTRREIRILKPKVWGLVVLPTVEEFYEFCRSHIARRNTYSSIADLFQDNSLQELIGKHLSEISLSYQNYDTVRCLKDEWRLALVWKERAFMFLTAVFITAGLFLIVCGSLGYVPDDLVYIITAIIVGLLVISSILSALKWRLAIQCREKHGKYLDIVEDIEERIDDV